MTKARETKPTTPEGDDFKEVINLLSVLSEATSRLAVLEGNVNAELLELIDSNKAEYSELQLVCTQSETALETYCLKHPEWFTTKKSITTPYGTVSFKSGSKLVIKDPEATIRLLRAEFLVTNSQRGNDGTTPVFQSEDYIRKIEEPNLEALEKLDDADLKRFMVKREATTTFTAKAAKVDFGKAVKEAATSQN